ncbi:MAG: hypothetical protein R3F14_09495 [Polyangiaceae bacterium]
MLRPAAFRAAVLVLFSLAVLAAGLAWTPAAFAAGAPTVAVYIEGGDASAVAAEVQSVLPPELGVIDTKTFSAALRKAGQSAQLGNTLAVKGALRDRLLARAEKAREATGADVALLGRVRIGKLGKEVWLVWLAPGGDVKLDEAVSLRGSQDARTAALHEALDPLTKPLLPPPPEDPALTAAGTGTGTGAATDSTTGDTNGASGDTDSDSGSDSTSSSKRTPHNLGTSLFNASVAFESGGRLVAFTDAISANIRPYEVLGAPMVHVAGEVYPAAGTGLPVLKDLGLTARFSMAFGLTSTTAGGEATTSNTWIRFRGGLRWRLLPGGPRGPILALTGDFGLDTFAFDDAGPLADSVPSVEYQYLRAGADMRFPIGPVALEIGGGYRGLLSVGETGDRFRDTQALAFDALAGFAVTLPAGFELRLSADYTRVFYAFKPIPGDVYVAGGLVDEMLGARLGATYIY